MQRWKTLVPERNGSRRKRKAVPYIGRFPETFFERVMQYVPVRDVLALSAVCKRLCVVARSEAVWRGRVELLGWGEGDRGGPGPAPREAGGGSGPGHRSGSLQRSSTGTPASSAGQTAPPGPNGPGGVPRGEDTERGGPREGPPDTGETVIDPSGTLDAPGKPKTDGAQLGPSSNAGGKAKGSLARFVAAVTTLRPYLVSLEHHTTSSLVFTADLTHLERAQILAALYRLCDPQLAPLCGGPPAAPIARPNTRIAGDGLMGGDEDDTLIGFTGTVGSGSRTNLTGGATSGSPILPAARPTIASTAEFYESTLLSEFERADSRRDEPALAALAHAVAALDLRGATDLDQASIVQIFMQRRERALGAIRRSSTEAFFADVHTLIATQGAEIARVFPPHLDVLLYYFSHVINDAVADFVLSSFAIEDAETAGAPQLTAAAAAFQAVQSLVPTLLAVKPQNPRLSRAAAERVVFTMFEPAMDDILEGEKEHARRALTELCAASPSKSATAFLSSANPYAVKQNFLQGFTKALFLPMTIIPKTAVSTFSALATLNPLASQTHQASELGQSPDPKTAGANNEGSGEARKPGEEAIPNVDTDKVVLQTNSMSPPILSATDNEQLSRATLALPTEGDDVWGSSSDPQMQHTETVWSESTDAANISQMGLEQSMGGLSLNQTGAEKRPSLPRADSFETRLDLHLLLSLDTATQLIQTNRESLKRVETYIDYPDYYGRKVHDTIEEVFIILMQVLNEKYITPAFTDARAHMEAYKPNENDHTLAVVPLVEFFELVHVGDTIQQMVDVYYTREMSKYVSKMDFANVVVREKKRFELAIDDCVAQGLNSGVNLLMDDTEHVIFAYQNAHDFNPYPDAAFDLVPTEACTHSIRVLKTHSEMLKGSTDKQIMDVFNQEVGLRLFSTLLKHIKNQTVSVEGGLRLICDLNAYYAFIQTFRLPNVTAYFSCLKMVGELFIIESPKELSMLVRDVSRYEGIMSTEDLYECVQRRADWKLIEKQVEKQLFGIKIADDCIIA